MCVSKDGEMGDGEHALAGAKNEEEPADITRTESGDGWIELVDDDRYRHMVSREESFAFGLSSVAETVSSTVPEAVAAADAVAQYGHAVIRFPEGKGFADLMDRKGEDFIGWKHFTVRATDGGVGGGNAALKQVGLTGPAIANMALAGVSMVVGQANMVAIRQEIASLKTGLEEIKWLIETEYISDLEGKAESLDEYRSQFESFSANPLRRQATLNDIVAIGSRLRGYLSKEKKELRRIEDKVRGIGSSDEAQARDLIREFDKCVARASYALILSVVSARLELAYSADYSSAAIRGMAGRIDSQGTSLLEAQQKCRAALKGMAEGIEGPIWERLATHLGREDGKTDNIPGMIGMRTAGIVGAVVGSLLGIAAQAGGDAARRSKEERRNELIEEVGTRSGSLEGVLDAGRAEFDRIEFIYNKANALSCSDDGMSFVVIDDGEVCQGSADVSSEDASSNDAVSEVATSTNSRESGE